MKHFPMKYFIDNADAGYPETDSWREAMEIAYRQGGQPYQAASNPGPWIPAEALGRLADIFPWGLPQDEEGQDLILEALGL